MNARLIRKHAICIALSSFLCIFSLCRGVAAQTPAPEQSAPPAANQAPAPASAAATPDAPPAPQNASVVIKKESRLVLVDAVVTDKKGNYVKDLSQKDFKVYEDNKEQPVASFNSGFDTAIQANAKKHYLILFFDNASMAAPDQIQARGAAAKFVQANAGPDR